MSWVAKLEKELHFNWSVTV